MAIDPERFNELVSEFVNALQVALLLSATVDRNLQQSAQDAARLRAAVERATTAVQLQRPRTGEENTSAATDV